MKTVTFNFDSAAVQLLYSGCAEMGATVGRLLGSAEDSAIVPSQVIQTKYGPIIGKRIFGLGEHHVDAFLGIPFAKPPIGELRFKVKIQFEF